MNVIVSSRHAEVPAELKTYAQEKADKLTKYYDRIQEIEVVFEQDKDRHHVEILVNAEHNHTFVAHERDAASLHAGVDACVEKLKHQLSDHHKKVKNRKHPNDSIPG